VRGARGRGEGVGFCDAGIVVGADEGGAVLVVGGGGAKMAAIVVVSRALGEGESVSWLIAGKEGNVVDCTAVPSA